MSVRKRILPAIAGLALAAGLAVPITLATATAASASPAGTLLFTATTVITNDGANAGSGADFSTYGVWAIDGPGSSGFTRTLSFYKEPASTCNTQFSTTLPVTESCYSMTIADNGDFQTVNNADQPNQGSTNTADATDNKIINQVSGTFSGTASYVFDAPSSEPPSAAYVAASLDNGDSPDFSRPAGDNTQTWYDQAFPSHTGVTQAVQLNDWRWKYQTTSCGETWTDAFGDGNTTNGFDSYGQSTPISLFGNITGLIPGNPGCTPDTVSVTNPGNQTTNVGASVTLGISASATDGDTVTSYSATGLPAGLSINGGTGVITGTVTTPETTTVTVTASDGDESGSATFSWTVAGLTVTPPPTSNYGDEVNPFGNGFDVLQQHAVTGQPVVGWPATRHDPATHFLAETEGSNFRFEYAPFGTGTGLCISNPGNNALMLKPCNPNIWQQFSRSGSHIISAVNGGTVNPDGKGAQLTVGSSAVSWGGSAYVFTPFASLPA